MQKQALDLCVLMDWSVFVCFCLFIPQTHNCKHFVHICKSVCMCVHAYVRVSVYSLYASVCVCVCVCVFICYVNDRGSVV